ncbi:hypothetical protein ACFS33_06275 [Cellulomonas phragmiteti]|uniref:hypothetical protein n=1 Tax=Cellulomonas phragmiteti TaxID=478780 RepID=UPI0036299325
MASAEHLHEVVRVPGDLRHLLDVGDVLPGRRDVMGVVGLADVCLLEDDALDLADRERRALDVVREVGLVERHIRGARRVGDVALHQMET